MDLTRIPGLKGRPTSSAQHRTNEAVKSPLPSSPSISASSPSSAPSYPSSSPSSSSSSPSATVTGYHNDVKGQVKSGSSNSVKGDVVSSTSASLAPPSQSTPPLLSSNQSLNPPHSGVHGRRDGGETDIYDPFHPTEGEREGGVAANEEEEEEEGEKYDPFEPTGSPVSENEGMTVKDLLNKSNGSDNQEARGARRKAEMERATERRGQGKKNEPPPDSTYTLPTAPTSPRSLPLPLRRRLDREANKTIERGKGRKTRQNPDSDHSEIEEGEIVGATERDGGQRARANEGILSIPSGSPFLVGSKPERILRVLDGESFVSVMAEGDWVAPGPGAMDVDEEPEAEPLVVGVGDLRRKLVSRRKERYRPCPSSLSPQPLPQLPLPSPSPPSTTLPLSIEKEGKARKTSNGSKERERRKRKEGRMGEKEERKRKKKKKEKEGNGRGKSSERKDRVRGQKNEREEKGSREDMGRSSRSNSRKRKKRRQSSPEASHSHNSSGRLTHSRRSWSSLSEDHHRERDREQDRDRERDGDRDRNGDRRRDERARDGDSSRRKRDGERDSSSREKGSSKRSKGGREQRDRDREQERDRERESNRERDRRRDGRSVVPPSIQDLNGSDLFAIKRTITVTTTTTTVPSSPPLDLPSPRSPAQGSDKPHKRKKKRRRHSEDEAEDGACRHSRSPSLHHYRGYDSDRYSGKLEIDTLSLDGEALDSDYPSLEDSPPQAAPSEPPPLCPKPKVTLKSKRHHLKKKLRTGKKTVQLESSSIRPTSKGLPSLLSTQAAASSGQASLTPATPSTKRGHKVAKEKEREGKPGKKESGRSSRSKKLSGSRKGKLQSKVSVLVREGVSSTTGGSAGSGKLGMDLLGTGGPGGGSCGQVVGGSIAVVFRRDNESRSPFLKPCTEPLSLSGRNKDLGKEGKRNSLTSASSSLSNPGLMSKKAKPSSTTSTSSSASSPSSSLATKRRRRLGKKTREKVVAGGLADENVGKANCSIEGWDGASTEAQSCLGSGGKASSPHTGLVCLPPCQSLSLSSMSVIPPSSSPTHTPLPSLPPLRDARESSPDSQTVDSSCKTPELSFLREDCSSQTTPNPPASSSPLPMASQGAGTCISQSTPNVKLPVDDCPKPLASPPCSSSSSGSAPASLSLPPCSTDPSSSSSSSVSSSSANKPPPPPPPPPAVPPLPWSLQTGVDCTAGGVLALTALLFKMEEANIASRAKAQEFIQATSQILSQANQNQSQQLAPQSSSSSSTSHIPLPSSLHPTPGPTPAQFILHGCTKTPPSHLLPGMSIGCAQTPPPPLPIGFSGITRGSSETGWDSESKDPDKYLKKLHTQERAVEEVKLAIKPYYQRKDINKDEYKDILRKAVHKICHSRTGEINPVKVSNLVKLYVQRYKYFRKHGRKMDEEEREEREQGALNSYS